MADPIFSPDGNYMWTGSDWIPAPPSSNTNPGNLPENYPPKPNYPSKPNYTPAANHQQTPRKDASNEITNQQRWLKHCKMIERKFSYRIKWLSFKLSIITFLPLLVAGLILGVGGEVGVPDYLFAFPISFFIVFIIMLYAYPSERTYKIIKKNKKVYFRCSYCNQFETKQTFFGSEQEKMKQHWKESGHWREIVADSKIGNLAANYLENG